VSETCKINGHAELARLIDEEPAPLVSQHPIAHLLGGIPIVLDDSMPPNVWRVVDTVSGEVLHEGLL